MLSRGLREREREGEREGGGKEGESQPSGSCLLCGQAVECPRVSVGNCQQPVEVNRVIVCPEGGTIELMVSRLVPRGM